jgi:DNA-binding SARP family transcriptional activator
VSVPGDGPGTLPRSRLEDRLDEACHRRLTLVTAAPGLGKTTLLAAWARRRNAAWYSVGADDRNPQILARGILEAARKWVPSLDPGAVAPSIAGEGWATPSEGQESLAADEVLGMFTEYLDRDLTVVLDDVHELGDANLAGRLLGDLVRGAPPGLHIVLSSRTDPPFGVARLRAQGHAVDLPGSDLRFTETETEVMVRSVLGTAGDDLVALIHQQTAGWPAAVRVISEWLRPAPRSLWWEKVPNAAHAGGPLEAFLVEDVLPAVPESVLELLRAVASLERFTAPLAVEFVGPGGEELVTLVARDGLWVVPDHEHPGWFVVPPMLRRVIQSRLAVRPSDTAIVLRRAAAWLEGQGETGPALTGLLAGAGEGDGRSSTVGVGTGVGVGTEVMVGVGSRGGGGGVRGGLPDVSGERRDEAAAFVEAGARLVRGDYDGSLALLRPALAGDGAVPMSAGLVAGLVHHFRGELDQATAMYERALAGRGTDALRAMVLGWAASAAWVTGDEARCRRLTELTVVTAERSNDDRALAMAHTALGMLAAFDGDRRAMQHYERALAHAEAAHDHVQIVRIRTNRGSRLLSEGHYREALGELDEAARLGDLAGIALVGSLALVNKGEALIGLGRLDEAARELEAAKARYERIGSWLAGYALHHLGTVYRLQGHLTLARAHYEEAIAIGDASRNTQGLVPALAGLALVLADTDPAEAVRLSERALALASLARPKALIAAAEAAIRTGDLVAAASRADEASMAARTRHDQATLADALELQARIVDDAAAASGLLDEAATIWAAIGNPLGEARVLLAHARLGGTGSPAAAAAAAAAAAEAEQTLRRLGARTLAAEAAAVRVQLAHSSHPMLAVRVLGGFGVERYGIAVQTTEWQSRKARDLLKVLVARRGRPLPREVILELLWPGEDPSRAGSRLSVALSTLRAVLDPGKQFEAEHFVANDRTAAWLRLEHISVDVEVFLTSAHQGLRAVATGDAEDARPLLTTAETIYAGDFLEEDLYEDWSVVVREEARATYVSVAMALADLALSAGDHDGATRYLLRVLARDPYDERAHLHLVTALTAAGRHGEARRMYRSYCGRMADIDVEPAAFPNALVRPPTG